MQLSEIVELIRKREYCRAKTELMEILKTGSEEEIAKSYYYLGYINTCYDYKERSDVQATRFLRYNLNSAYPVSHAYVLFARHEQDKNIAVNYLQKGTQTFPSNPQLYNALLRYSQDKDGVVQRISDVGFTDPELLGSVISHLVATNQWDKISQFAIRLENNNALDTKETAYLDLIRGYTLLFAPDADLTQTISIFEKVISEDTDNRFAYAHYMGIIYAYIQSNNLQKATEYFDRFPLTNAIHDLDDRPMALGIEINFEQQYGVIFAAVINMYQADPLRKAKAEVLRSLYRYSPSVMFDVCRYQKKDAAILTRFLKSEFIPEVAAALYCMRCHFQQFKEAYEVLWMLLRQGVDLEQYDIYLSEITEHVTDAELLDIANITLSYIKDDDYGAYTLYDSIFCELIKALHKAEKYDTIRQITQCFSVEQLANCKCAFECAFALGKADDSRTIKIYDSIISKNPSNTSAINNIGVQYERRGDLYRALECYKTALHRQPEEQIYQNNFKRINDLIRTQLSGEISKICKGISIKNLETIGYTTELCQKILAVQDEDMRRIILRDLRECAIAIVAGQDKMSTIMCGSIMEAVLMQKLTELGIAKYDISEISHSKHATNYPLIDMGLNELLFVADKEKLLDKNSYHLGHYIRDYRNVVHPAKEKRSKEEITHSNVLTMWSVLKRLVDELYPKSRIL